jgi:hypothetical protein
MNRFPSGVSTNTREARLGEPILRYISHPGASSFPELHPATLVMPVGLVNVFEARSNNIDGPTPVISAHRCLERGLGGEERHLSPVTG